MRLAVPIFSKGKERLLLILAKFLVWHCTLLVSNKNIFAHLVTLVCIPFLQLCDYIRHPNNKSLKVSEGVKERFFILEVGSGKKRGRDKISKSGWGTKMGKPRFFKKLEGGNYLGGRCDCCKIS